MLLLTLFFIIIIDPKVITSKALAQSLSDPRVIMIAAMTTLAMTLYYYILSSNHLYVCSLMWPAIMLFTIIGAYVIFKERIAPKQWFGIALTFIGISITILFQEKN
jgi:drug/metabolite transporter (DMT)-like permease